jgi:cytochrome c oxidase assembly protein subunit 15
MDSHATRAEQGAADILALGFGTTVAMWAVGYLVHLPGLELPKSAIGVLLAAVLLGGGIIAGKRTSRGWLGAMQVGLLAGLLNLLIFASVVGKSLSSGGSTAILALLASVVASGVICTIGAAIGAGMRKLDRPEPDWSHSFVGAACAAMLLLIFAGGLVTSLKAGLAVPDWPTSFGYGMFLLPLADMTGGVYYEHAHRLLGSLVGLTTLVLFVHLARGRWTPTVKTVAGLVFLLVCIQGVIGGLRVTDKSIALAVVHGVLAQGVFALLVALLALTHPAYRAPLGDTEVPPPRGGAKWLLGLLLVQLIVGTLYRQSDNVNSHWSMLHMALGVGITVMALLTGLRYSRGYAGQPAQAGKGVLHVVGLQFLLGIATFGCLMALGQHAPAAVVLATLHQTNGALLLGMAARLLVWAKRPAVVVAPQ